MELMSTLHGSAPSLHRRVGGCVPLEGTIALARDCDTPNPGCPLTTRQPAEIYMSHVVRPIHVQKWPLGPTHHTHKMYILYKNDLITICLQLYLITIYTKMGLLPRIFLQNTR